MYAYEWECIYREGMGLASIRSSRWCSIGLGIRMLLLLRAELCLHGGRLCESNYVATCLHTQKSLLAISAIYT